MKSAAFLLFALSFPVLLKPRHSCSLLSRPCSCYLRLCADAGCIYQRSVLLGMYLRMRPL